METSTFEQRIEKLRNSQAIISSGQEYVGLYELNNRSAEKFIRANLRGNYVNIDTATIYYKDNTGNDETLKKEVIGGYILFPGDGSPAEVANAKFQQSLDEVNIGAFPLRPKDKENRKLLEEFIQKLIGSSASKILDEAIPQKGLHYTENEPVYFVISGTKKENPEDWEKLHQGLPCRFCCGFKGPREDVDLQSIRFLAPVFGHQFYGYYKVRAVRTKELSDIQYPVRVEFELSDYTAFSSPVKYGIPNAPRGVPFSHRAYFEYCSKHSIS